jgi:hypothetical protein
VTLSTSRVAVGCTDLSFTEGVNDEFVVFVNDGAGDYTTTYTIRVTTPSYYTYEEFASELQSKIQTTAEGYGNLSTVTYSEGRYTISINGDGADLFQEITTLGFQASDTQTGANSMLTILGFTEPSYTTYADEISGSVASDIDVVSNCP